MPFPSLSVIRVYFSRNTVKVAVGKSSVIGEVDANGEDKVAFSSLSRTSATAAAKKRSNEARLSAR